MALTSEKKEPFLKSPFPRSGLRGSYFMGCIITSNTTLPACEPMNGALERRDVIIIARGYETEK